MKTVLGYLALIWDLLKWIPRNAALKIYEAIQFEKTWYSITMGIIMLVPFVYLTVWHNIGYTILFFIFVAFVDLLLVVKLSKNVNFITHKNFLSLCISGLFCVIFLTIHVGVGGASSSENSVHEKLGEVVLTSKNYKEGSSGNINIQRTNSKKLHKAYVRASCRVGDVGKIFYSYQEFFIGGERVHEQYYISCKEPEPKPTIIQVEG